VKNEERVGYSSGWTVDEDGRPGPDPARVSHPDRYLADTATGQRT
jgi:hypothetical protein